MLTLASLAVVRRPIAGCSFGGAAFWLAPSPGQFPALAIRVSGEFADVHYFPHGNHPGFRFLGRLELPVGATTLFVFEGCDPASGEAVPNEFITSATTALSVAGAFFDTQKLEDPDSWFEL